MKGLLKYCMLVGLILLVCCQQVNKDPLKKDIEEYNSKEEHKRDEILKEIYHRFPSPEEMLAFIDKETVEVDKLLLNNPGKSMQYLDSRSQALNLGVYIADLAYLTLFEQHKESFSYFEAIFNLSEKLRISAAFDLTMLKRVQNNVTNPDSLSSLTEYAFTEITNYLVSNDKEKTFAIVSLGGFIEALYLSINLVDEFSENNQIVQRIVDQKLVLDNLLAYSQVLSDDDAVASAIELISPIQKVYSNIVARPNETKVSRSADGRIIISGGDKLVINRQQFTELSKVTMGVRNKIIQN